MATLAERVTDRDPPTIRHKIAPDHDFLIIAKEVRYRHAKDGKPLIVCVHEFEVIKKTFAEFDYFKAVFKPDTFADTGKDSYEVEEDHPAALKIWMQLLHDRLDESSLKVDIATVWHVLVVARKYDFDALGQEAKDWFKKWYQAPGHRFDTLQFRQLIYPCYTFDCAEGFAAATKDLAYNIQGHIEEEMPLGVSDEQEEQRLRSRAIMVLNGARGSMRTKLQGDLQRPIVDVVEKSNSSSKKDVLWAYTAALINTAAWPVDIKAKGKSIYELHHLLDNFKYVDPHPNGNCTCSNYNQVVKRAIKSSRENFQGLCLDCMMSSSKNEENEDKDYWTHATRGVYDNDCRISHGQPTWYFSFMGRKEKMDLFKKKDKAKGKDH